MRSLSIALSIVVSALAGCQTPSVKVHSNDSAAVDQVMLGEIAKLSGDWYGLDPEGNEIHAATFSVTSQQSAVRELMYPGHEYEMTNLYHMDGENLVLTHYCAAGNQPRMMAAKATASDEGTVFQFDIDSVSNLRESHEHYMGYMTLTILGEDRIRQVWRSYDRKGALTDPMEIMLTRK